MHKADKERLVEELTKRLGETESLIVADYRGLTNSQLEGVRAKLREHGATFTVVKNTLTRRAAEAAGTESLLALLEGPTAIAFVEANGDPAAVAKALADTAKDAKVLSLRGGILSGSTMGAAEVEQLAKLPPADVLKSQLVGVIVAPLTQLLGLLQAPLRDLVGLVDARIEQLGGQPDESPTAEAVPEEGTPPPGDAPAEATAPAEDTRAEVAEVAADEVGAEPAEQAAEPAEDEPAADEQAADAGDDPTSNEITETEPNQEEQE